MWQKIQLLDTWVLNTDPYSPQKVEDIAIVSVEKQVMDMMKVRCTQNLVVPLTVLGVFLSTCLFWAGHQPATVQRDLPGQPEEPEAAVQWQRVEGDASCLPMGKPSQKLWLFKLNKRFIMHFGCVVLCRASNPGCVTGWSSRWPSRSLQAPPLSQVTAAFLHAVSTQTSIWRTVFNHFFFRCFDSLYDQEQMPDGGHTWSGKDWRIQAPVWRAGPLQAHAVLARYRLLLVCGSVRQPHPGHHHARPPRLSKR